MTKKLKTRLLLVVVASIWGYNIYRGYMNYQTEQLLEESNQTYNQSNFSPLMFNKDSFELDLPEVDPFLKKSGKWSATSANNSNTSASTNPIMVKKDVKPIVKEVKSWPKVSYLGFVKNLNKQTPLCLLKINGQMIKLSKGQEQGGIFVSTVFKDSVYLVFQGEERTFVKD